MPSLIDRFENTLLHWNPAGDPRREELLIAREGDLEIYYVPFERVVESARLMIVGLTPGKQQMALSIAAYANARRSGLDHRAAQNEGYRAGAFGGSLRNRLVRMLDHIRINEWLKVESSSALLDGDSRLVQTTSALRYPVFRRGENYRGAPGLAGNALLRSHLLTYFASEATKLSNAYILPLGTHAALAVALLVSERIVSQGRVLPHLPHPSGANNGRSAEFLRAEQAEYRALVSSLPNLGAD